MLRDPLIALGAIESDGDRDRLRQLARAAAMASPANIETWARVLRDEYTRGTSIDEIASLVGRYSQGEAVVWPSTVRHIALSMAIGERATPAPGKQEPMIDTYVDPFGEKKYRITNTVHAMLDLASVVEQHGGDRGPVIASRMREAGKDRGAEETITVELYVTEAAALSSALEA
ncbi:MAG: hypothetical protein M3457_05040 [Chloroflexota bacterium]|nr:hypothetical protein [Chloroflexota bacterium]